MKTIKECLSTILIIIFLLVAMAGVASISAHFQHQYQLDGFEAQFGSEFRNCIDQMTSGSQSVMSAAAKSKYTSQGIIEIIELFVHLMLVVLFSIVITKRSKRI